MRSWLHLELKSCPLDCRTSIHSNVFPATIQHSRIYQGCCKNTKSTFQCIVFLQSRGQSPKRFKSKRQICPPTFNRIRTLSPGLEELNIKMSNLYFSNIPGIISTLENCLNNISMFGCAPIQGTAYFFRGNSNEVRISEWNIRENIPHLHQEFPWTLSSGTPSGKEVYLTVYPLSCPNTETI